MTAYFDTSALAKYFHTESGSTAVINIIDDAGNTFGYRSWPSPNF